MTFHYKTDPRDAWAINIMVIIRRPLARNTTIGLLIAIFCVACTLSYLRTGTGIVKAVAETAGAMAIGLGSFWMIGRSLITRLAMAENAPETQELTISQDGFAVRTRMGAASYSWAAVFEIVVSKKYAYIFVVGTTGYAFARTGFESPDVASTFFSQILSSVEATRVVLLGKVKVSGESKQE